MEKEVYYRYIYGNKSIFSAVDNFENKESKKRFGKLWAKELKKWTDKINKNIRWLFDPQSKKEVKFYFKEAGMKKYEKRLFKIHKDMLNPKKTPFKISKKILNHEKIRKLRIICFRKKINDKKFLYNLKTKKKLGKIIYEDKHQIGII